MYIQCIYSIYSVYISITVLDKTICSNTKILKIKFKHATSFISTVMHRLTTGILSKKRVVRRFHRCTNVTECTPTNLDGRAYYTPRLHDTAYCS